MCKIDSESVGIQNLARSRCSALHTLALWRLRGRRDVCGISHEALLPKPTMLVEDCDCYHVFDAAALECAGNGDANVGRP